MSLKIKLWATLDWKCECIQGYKHITSAERMLTVTLPEAWATASPPHGGAIAVGGLQQKASLPRLQRTSLGLREGKGLSPAF